MLATIYCLFYNEVPMIPLEKKVAQALIKKRKTLSLAESCTGGLIANRLTNISGSSRFFKLGIIAYANSAKTKLLKVPPSALKKYGAVSHQVALLMAKNVRGLSKTDFGIGVTGIAGPSGATKNKRVGLVYIALDSKKQALSLRFLFKGKRTTVKSQAASKALQLLLDCIA